MKSNLPQDGHFPYGNQASYRDFLLPKELEAQFLRMNEYNRNTSDPLIIAKYFNPMGTHTWYMTQYNPENQCFYGFITGVEFPEWESVSLDYFISGEFPFGMKMHRDLDFPFQPFFSDAVSEEDKQGF